MAKRKPPCSRPVWGGTWRSGGCAVADLRTARPGLGAMEDLEKLAQACRKEGVSRCMDFVMNHTSQDHEWAKRARTDVRTLDTGDGGALAIRRYWDGQKLIGVFSFIPEDKTAAAHDPVEFTGLLSGEKHILQSLQLPAYGFCCLGQKAGLA